MPSSQPSHQIPACAQHDKQEFAGPNDNFSYLPALYSSVLGPLLQARGSRILFRMGFLRSLLYSLARLRMSLPVATPGVRKLPVVP